MRNDSTLSNGYINPRFPSTDLVGVDVVVVFLGHQRRQRHGLCEGHDAHHHALEAVVVDVGEGRH